jgi:fibronectin type 3 domain-containing protein
LQLNPASSSNPSSPEQHEVSISWSAPTGSDTPIAGYKIYRATGEGGAFSLLDSIDQQTSYADSTVQGGTTYGYQVRSVDSSGNESSPSNTAYISLP